MRPTWAVTSRNEAIRHWHDVIAIGQQLIILIHVSPVPSPTPDALFATLQFDHNNWTQTNINAFLPLLFVYFQCEFVGFELMVFSQSFCPEQ